MHINKLNRIIISVFMAFFMMLEGALSLPVFAQSEAVLDAEVSEISEESDVPEETNVSEEPGVSDVSDVSEEYIDDASDDGKSDVEDMLIYEDEKTTEEELQENADVDYDGYIFKIRENTSIEAKEETEARICQAEENSDRIEAIGENSLYKADSLETISEVAEVEVIEYIEPDIRCELYEDVSADLMASGYSSNPNDPYFNNKDYAWAWTKTCAPDAWKMGYYGQSGDGRKVTVAVIDTGVASYHPDLNYSRIDSRGTTYYKDTTESGCADEHGHGTFVTGVINATMNNGKGVTGAMPGLNVLPIKIYKKISSGLDGGYISDIIRALDKAIEVKADVVNMSFGTKSRVNSLDEACKKAIDAGIILISSVGNDGLDVINYPAGYDGVIGVGSVTSFLIKASSSNYNSSVDCVAAGLGVMGLVPGKSGESSSYYKLGSGTSYAAPQVAALAGMAKSIDRSINAYDFERILSMTCRDLGIAGRDDSYGYGVINYDKVATMVRAELNERTRVETMSEVESLGTAKIRTKYSTYTYTGKSIRPSVSVTLNGRALVNGRDYSTVYSNNINVGKATITVKGINGYTGSRKITYKIRPRTTKISSCSRYRGALKVKWSRRTKGMSRYHIRGYQVQVAKNSKFTKGLKSSYIKGYSKSSRKFTKLSRRTRYYVRVRTYMKVNGRTYYSKWSGTRNYRTK